MLRTLEKTLHTTVPPLAEMKPGLLAMLGHSMPSHHADVHHIKHIESDYTIAPRITPLSRRQYLPSVMMRAGTSKGLFIHQQDLPESPLQWNSVLLAIMGSRNPDPRQLDGVGGATSTTSKVAIVARSLKPGIDVDYTFGQVPIGGGDVDFSGNCGNMASGVAPFALDEGIITAPKGAKEMNITIFNTNTQRKIVATVQVSPDRWFQEAGDYKISPSLPSGSPIRLAFIEPAGSMTGRLFPSGNKIDTFEIASPELDSSNKIANIRATLIDAANPFILIDSDSLPQAFHDLDRNSPASLEFIERIRREGAVRMGLANDVEQAKLVRGTPKIAVVSRSSDLSGQWREQNKRSPNATVRISSYSMGRPHPAIQLTGAVCVGAALSVPGTVASDKALKDGNKDRKRDVPRERSFVIAHNSGTIDVIAKASASRTVESVSVYRTARRLFQGQVCYLE